MVNEHPFPISFPSGSIVDPERGLLMAKYLIKSSYTAEGTKGLLKEGGTSRKAIVEEMVQRLDGRLEAFYFGLGEADVYAIVDVPDVTSVVAVSMIVNASGAVTLSTIPLLTPEEIDQACKRSIDYRPPGA
jgi:uncharacterized protein with GYD domain